MKFDGSNAKKKLIKLGIFVAALVILLTVSQITHLSYSFSGFLKTLSFSIGQLLSLIIMVLSVLIFKELFSFLLDGCQFKNQRVQTITTILKSLLQYIAWLVIICWGLAIMGVDIGTIVASVGVLALIIGFGAESLIADVVTGLFMLIENQYNVGDIVELDGYRGTVIAIGIRTTSIEDTSGNVKIINNSSMVNVLNRSEHASKAVVDFPIPYSTDLRKLESQLDDLLQKIYDEHPDVMKEAPKYLGVQTLGTSEIVLRFVASVSEEDIFSTTRLLNHDLLLGMRDLGIECPFPQLDVHTN